jgi:hypothetical protein
VLQGMIDRLIEIGRHYIMEMNVRKKISLWESYGNHKQ